MRTTVLLGIGVLLGTAWQAGARQEDQEPLRYGIHARLNDYPQGSPQEALGSVVAAITNGRLHYLLAQLTDPEFVDQRVGQVYAGHFEELVQETRTKLNDNPDTVKLLRRFQTDGTWDTQGNRAAARLKDVPDRMVFLRKIGPRWYLENRQRPERLPGPRGETDQEPAPPDAGAPEKGAASPNLPQRKAAHAGATD